MAASIKAISTPEENSAGTPPLGTVLAHCTLVKALVEASLQDLSMVNRFFMDECVDAGRQATGNVPQERAGAIESRLNEARRVLEVASRALASEIKERRMLDHQFAAVQEQEATGRHRMLHDALTSMPNRILFQDRLEHGLAQSLRHRRPLAVMFIDLDGFKAVNDTYGHDVGDAVLQELATRLKEHTRGDDTASRYGGDEFLYLLADPGDHQSIESIAERMIRLIREPYHVTLHGTEVSLSLDASIGIAVSPKDGVSVATLVKSADEAMYRAKRGKTGYSFAL